MAADALAELIMLSDGTKPLPETVRSSCIHMRTILLKMP